MRETLVSRPHPQKGGEGTHPQKEVQGSGDETDLGTT